MTETRAPGDGRSVMLLHRYWAEALRIGLAAEWRPGIVALLAAAAAALGARLLGFRRSAAAAAALGLAVGWASVSNLPAWPRALSERLPELPAISLGCALLLGVRWAKRRRLPLLMAAALLSAWWLAGAPWHAPELLHSWRVLGIVAAWTGAALLLLAEADAWRVAAAAVALWAASNALAVPGPWARCALAAAAAVLGAVLAPQSPGALVPSAAGIGAVAGAAVVASGSLAHGRFGAVEVAALAPLAAAWFAGRMLPRFRRLGAAATPAAGLVALLGVVVLTYAAAALTGLR